jgi:hypothetical protein
VLVTGTVASVVSSAALTLPARERKGALQPINATSHWLYGDEAPRHARLLEPGQACGSAPRSAGERGAGAGRDPNGGDLGGLLGGTSVGGLLGSRCPFSRDDPAQVWRRLDMKSTNSTLLSNQAGALRSRSLK